ncbi:MAG TPA: hypothetical protein VF691_00975 [Cytophagaceae bacterium]|jgi:hypothetical protein
MINYIEDPDSLLFTLGVINFDISAFHPHFPSYPVFCCLAKMCYYVTDRFSVAFSILGGSSLFIIIVYALKILSVPLKSLEGGLTAALLFFNPMIWVMSNKFMPDLLGVALLMASLYYLLCDPKGNKYHIWLGYFLAGLLGGVRLSYLPFLFIPIVYGLLENKRYFSSLSMLSVGILIWIVPMLLHTGWEPMMSMTHLQSQSHFSDFGGAFYKHSNIGTRVVRLAQSLWADGLGAYWSGRNWVTILLSIAIVPFLFFGAMILLSFDFSLRKVAVISFSCTFFGLWVLLFQNIIYDSRHILPFIPFLVIVICYGIIYFLVNFNTYFTKVTLTIVLICYLYIGLSAALQHMKPSAIAQINTHLAQKEKNAELNIVSIPMVNFYLAKQGVKAHFFSAAKDVEKIKKLKGNIIIVGNFEHLVSAEPRARYTFKHDPYINRIWPQISASEYLVP